MMQSSHVIDGEGKFLPEEVQAYGELCDSIDAMERSQVEAALVTAQGRQAERKALVQEAQVEQQSLQEEMAATKDKLEGYESGFFSKLIRSDKERARKLGKHSALLREEEERLAACTKRIAAVEQELQLGGVEVAALAQLVQQLKGLQAASALQLLRLFCSPAWQADAGYQQLQHDCMQLEAQAAQARGIAGAFCRAKPLLDRASEKLRKALTSAEWAAQQGYRVVQEGMLQNHSHHAHHSPGAHAGFHSGHHHSSCSASMVGPTSTSTGSWSLIAARERVQKAARAIMKARAILPNLPHIQEALVSACLSGSFMGGAAAGMILVSEAQQTRSQINTMLSQVEACRAWVVSSLAAAQQQLARLEGAGASKAAELESFRRQQAQQAVAARRQRQWQNVQPSAPAMPSTPPLAQGFPVY